MSMLSRNFPFSPFLYLYPLSFRAFARAVCRTTVDSRAADNLWQNNSREIFPLMMRLLLPLLKASTSITRKSVPRA